MIDLTSLSDPAPAGDKRPRVLVVDDDTTVRDWFRPMLEIQGWDVSEAATAEEGIAVGAQVGPDVVILDQHLLGASGMAWARTLREQHPRAMLLMFAAIVDEETRAEGAALHVEPISKVDHRSFLQVMRAQRDAIHARSARRDEPLRPSRRTES